MRTSERRTTARAHRSFGVVLVGAFLLHLAWILAVPTFGGADEFDHVHKADAVAHGQLRGSEEATNGRGQLLSVRTEVVEAAEAVCASYPYTLPDNCRAVSSDVDGRVHIASAAASYNPTYYLVAGTLARPLDGAAYDIGLRLVTAALSSALLAAAVAVAVGRARTSWPLLALAVGVTPTLVYSGSIAAPNGVGYAAACLWWVCALAVVEERRPPYALLGLASVTLVTTHTLNVMWLPLMALVVLLLRPARWWTTLLRHPRAAAVATTVAAAGLACLVWIRSSGTNRLGEPVAELGPLQAADLASSQLVWSLQTVASFPMRNQSEHPALYVLWLAALGYVLVAGFRAATPIVRRAMGAVLALWFVVPMALTLASYESEGYAWQGRYALPLVLGLPLLAGMALDRRGVEVRRAPLHVGLGMLVVAHVWSTVAVAARESDRGLSPSLGNVLPLPALLVVVGLVSLVGLLTTLGGLRGTAAPLPQRERAVAR